MRAFCLLALLLLAACEANDGGGTTNGAYVGGGTGLNARIGGGAAGYFTHTR